MGASSGAPISGRKRGSIVVLPSGSLQVRVYAGVDPLTRKRLYLTSVIPAGPKAARQAEAERSDSSIRSTRNETRVRLWVNQAEIDAGQAPGMSSSDAARIRDLEQENRELRRANEVLKRAASFFGSVPP